MQIEASRWEFIMAWSCSLFYTLVTLYFGKGLTKRMATARMEGVKPMQIFTFSSCALVAKQQHFNCDWYKQLGFNGNLSSKFKPSFYWCNLQLARWLLALLFIGRQRKERKQIGGFLSCPVCSSRTCSGVCFSISFPYSDINKLGIKMKSEIRIKAQHLHFHVSLSEKRGRSYTICSFAGLLCSPRSKAIQQSWQTLSPLN